MNDWSPWKLIRAGFLLGIGFVIPLGVATYGGTVITYFVLPAFMEGFYLQEPAVGDAPTGAESGSANTSPATADSEPVQLETFRETKRGDHLLILGSIVNTGENPASSIQLEAELFDRQGLFVYECSEAIGRRLAAGDKENFQIDCGDGNAPTPEYATLTLRVIRTDAF